MKKINPINLLFIGVVVVLLILALFSLSNRQSAQDTAHEGITPTLDVPLSVTQTVQMILSATETTAPTVTPNPPTPTLEPPTATPLVLPDYFYIYSYLPHKQTYNIGCEARVAVDLAAYYDVYLTEYDFQINLPHSDNPDKGFVGDVNGPWGQIPPAAYGVHAAPVVDLLNEFGVDVEGGKGYTLEQIKESLAQSHPVIVWVIGTMEYSDPVEYTDSDGVTTVVAPYEHVVVLTGYDETSVRYVSNKNYADATYEVFLNHGVSWAT